MRRRRRVTHTVGLPKLPAPSGFTRRRSLCCDYGGAGPLALAEFGDTRVQSKMLPVLTSEAGGPQNDDSRASKDPRPRPDRLGRIGLAVPVRGSLGVRNT